MSENTYKFITGILYHGYDLCMVMNPSVNAYRRLDPHFEAPNEIKVSSTDRGSMVRIPIGNEKSARIEVRTVAPDVNPYLCFYALVKAGLDGMEADEAELKKMEKWAFEGETKKLPGDIYDALEYFEASKFMADVMNKDNHTKYAQLKRAAAGRSPKIWVRKLNPAKFYSIMKWRISCFGVIFNGR